MHSNLQIRKKSDGDPQLPMFQRDMALKKVTCIKAAKLPVSKKKKKMQKKKRKNKPKLKGQQIHTIAQLSILLH